MSLPQFPDRDNIPTREEVINQILSSIAMEELGLSHIINAEGEKLQYALGTIPGISGPDEPLTMEELLKLNESVHETLNSTMMNQFFLKEKMTSALSAAIMQGPTGPAGPMTTILGNYNSLEELHEYHPTGQPGDAYLVGRELYVWDDETGDWISAGDLTGPTGPEGPTGPVGVILDSFVDLDDLIDNHPTGTVGDLYLAGGELYMWDNTGGTWESLGSMVGETGPDGASAYDVAVEQGFVGDENEWLDSLVGATGPVGAILGQVPTYGDLPLDPDPGDTYLVGDDGELFVWLDGVWVSMGNFVGPAGPTERIIYAQNTCLKYGERLLW